MSRSLKSPKNDFYWGGGNAFIQFKNKNSSAIHAYIIHQYCFQLKIFPGAEMNSSEYF
jgi:hypothetical protein